MCNKIEEIMKENNWNAKADKLFLKLVEKLNATGKSLIKEYLVEDICAICDEINLEMKLNSSTLIYAKNILFSNAKGREYFIFRDDFDVDKFTKELNKPTFKRIIETDYKKKKVYINPRYIEKVYAGKNEQNFICEFEKKYGKSILKGKKVFRNRDNDVNISVDNSIENENKTVLIEIDSGNMAKLLVGQYFLLNKLIHNEEKSNHIFVVVHYYKDYNPNRTEKNLELVKKYMGEDAIEFKVFTRDNFIEFYDKSDVEGLVNKLFTYS